MSFQDKTLECSDCVTSFTFSAEEQEHFQSRGYTNEPNSYRPRRQMFPVVCSDCGKETEVPFEPSQGRPVYCSDCYRKVAPRR
jgi:CxxC-x17-CxxC domain-containing protein